MTTTTTTTECGTYAEILDVSEDLIVESKVVGWDDINTSLLLELPVCKTETLGLSEESLLVNLSRPECFSGLLKISEHAHAWETENSSVLH
jgi:hypothetical protein